MWGHPNLIFGSVSAGAAQTKSAGRFPTSGAQRSRCAGAGVDFSKDTDASPSGLVFTNYRAIIPGGILKLVVVLLLIRLVEHHLVFPRKHVRAPILQYRLQDEVSVGLPAVVRFPRRAGVRAFPPPRPCKKGASSTK